MAQSDSAPTLKVVGAPDAAGVARAQNKARPNGNAPLREVSPPLYNLIFYVPVVESIVRGNDTHTAQSVYFALILR